MHLGDRPLASSHRAARRAASILAAVVGLVVAAGLAAPAYAAPAPTTLALGGTAAPAGAQTPLALILRTTAGAPVASASVVVDRRVGGVWQPIGTVTTDASGRGQVQVAMSRVGADNVFRATYAGDATYAAASASATVALVKRESRLTLHGARRVVDGRAVTLEVRRRTANGEPVAGPVGLYRKDQKGRWRLVRQVRTGADGTARTSVRPRVDTVWSARASALDWVRGARSKGALRIDNVPPGKRVRLPKSAPKPRVRLPRQQRAVGTGANLSITTIPAATWRQMTGRSWHRGCPVGRAGLRLVRVNHWGYDGYRYRGEIVANARAARAMGNALAEMHERRFPIRAMYRVDRFGWSKRLGGADDYRSMSAGNTSAFNCRNVVGRPGVRSPHSSGNSLDVNTWENPYRSSHGLVPNSYWQSRSHRLVAWRSSSHPVVRLMARHGLRWTYGNGDNHHFDYVGRGGAARPLAHLHPQCDGFICE